MANVAYLLALLSSVFVNTSRACFDIEHPEGDPLGGPLALNPIACVEDTRTELRKQGDRMDFVEDAAKGILTITDGGTPVLTYRFGDQLRSGVDPKFVRSSYIHPLCALDGRPLTDDFPLDHVHHHGLFWGWPVVKVRGQTTNNWEVGSPPLRQYFVRWLKRSQEGSVAALAVENAWKLDGREVVAEEILGILVYPADSVGRAIDLEIRIIAAGGPLELQGTPDQNKGYGGLCFRSAPLLKSAVMTTDKGRLGEDVVNTPFLWADISTAELGVAVFAAPGHPGAPVHWLIRTSYAGVINPSWPGLKPVTLPPGQPVVLRYRIYVHSGDAGKGDVAEKYRLFVQEREAEPSSRLLRAPF